MLRYTIPGYARRRKRRHRELLTYLSDEGWEATDEFKQLEASAPTNADELTIETLALDLNGTLSIDGKLIEGVVECLQQVHLADVRLLLLTGDVRGTALEIQKRLAAESVPIELVVCKDPRGTAFAKFLQLLKLDHTRLAYMGNGQGDVLAVQLADFSVALTQGEFASSETIRYAVGHETSIVRALSGLLSESTMRASFHQ